MTVAAMRAAAAALVAATDEPALIRLTMTRDDPDFRSWTYVPGDRAGLCTEEMGPGQYDIVRALLEAAHGTVGSELVGGAISVERLRRELQDGSPPGGDRYWVRLHGDPEASRRWGWRVTGHHLAVHVEVDGDGATLTPHFVGAQPAEVRHGPRAGLRILAAEEDLARALLHSLSTTQRKTAVWTADPPGDILTRSDPMADPSVLPDGLPYPEMAAESRSLCERLVRRYFERAPTAYADACWAEARQAPEQISFAWAGSPDRGRPHYYCLRGPGFLVEYDNSQDGGNHAHSVWRQLRDDFGGDPLRSHYTQSGQHAPTVR